MTFSSLLSIRSHPVRVRGLKHIIHKHLEMLFVAPRAGAWIETYLYRFNIEEKTVSHPVRVRGLKQSVKDEIQALKDSRTPCGCVD